MIEFAPIQADDPDLRALPTAENLPTKDLLNDQKLEFTAINRDDVPERVANNV